jgi:hypothetical protein
MFPLYIDPGTGSMLFSIVIGATATAYFLVRAMWIKAKVFISGGRIKQGASHNHVIYAEDKRYYDVFLPVIEIFEDQGIELLYLTSSEDDPVFERDWNYIKPEYIGTGNKAYARLNILSAKNLLTTTPGLDVYQWKRSKGINRYIYVPHYTTDFLTHTMFDLDYFDAILLTGDFQGNDIRKIEKLRSLREKELITVGCTYLDVSMKKIERIDAVKEKPYTVLVAPSWGSSALLSRYGEKLLDPLVETGYWIIVRPHPQSVISEQSMLEKLKRRYAETPRLQWDFERENIYSLAKADIMISDFSGVNFDFMFLCNKPVVYVNFEFDSRPKDAHFLPNEKIWLFEILKKAGIELREKDFSSIGEILKQASDSAELAEARQKARNEAWRYPGDAGKRIADFMLENGGVMEAPVDKADNAKYTGEVS